MPAGARRAILSDDTSPAAERQQIEIWRRMHPGEKAGLIAAACRSVRTLALAGLRSRHPTANDREIIARFAAMTLGRPLAVKAYPDLDAFDGPSPRD